MIQQFGNSAGSSAGQIFHRMRPQPLLNMKALSGTTNPEDIPTVRTGISNLFRVASTTSITLRNTETNTIVATITSTDHLSSGVYCAFYLSSVDQCLYVLLENNTSVQLIKINDTSGAVTAIGSPITPASIANWPNTASSVNFGFMDNPSGNNLRIINNGYIHQIDKSTGALLTEDVVVAIAGYSVSGIAYVNSAADIASHNTNIGIPSSSSTVLQSVYLPRVVATKCGRIEVIPVINTGFMLPAPESTNKFIAVDDNYLCFVDTSNKTPLKLVLRTDFERLLEDTVNFYAGLI